MINFPWKYYVHYTLPLIKIIIQDGQASPVFHGPVPTHARLLALLPEPETHLHWYVPLYRTSVSTPWYLYLGTYTLEPTLVSTPWYLLCKYCTLPLYLYHLVSVPVYPTLVTIGTNYNTVCTYRILLGLDNFAWAFFEALYVSPCQFIT